jgi:hypothetical protein
MAKWEDFNLSNQVKTGILWGRTSCLFFGFAHCQEIFVMMMKLLMSWDIKTGREQPYFEFIVREFAPKLMRLGLQPTEAWYTVYGEGPQILTGGITGDAETMNRILASDDWRALRDQLLTYVTNYDQKVVRASGTFQL